MARNNIKNPWNAVGFTCHYHARLIERSGSKQEEWINTRGWWMGRGKRGGGADLRNLKIKGRGILISILRSLSLSLVPSLPSLILCVKMLAEFLLSCKTGSEGIFQWLFMYKKYNNSYHHSSWNGVFLIPESESKSNL